MLDEKSEQSTPGEHSPKIDQEFLVKLWRRNWRHSLISFLVIFVGTILAFNVVKNSYKSTVIATFSRSDSASQSAESGLTMGFERSDWNFETRISDPNFLAKLAEYIGLESESGTKKILRRFGLGREQTDADRNAALVAFFSKHLFTSVNGGTGQLSLTALVDGAPRKSQELAALAMENFINAELAAAATRLGLKIDTLTTALRRSQERLARIKDAMKSGTAATKVAGNNNAPIDLRQRELDLLDRIKVTEREFSSVVDDQAKRRATLESEFERLSTRLSDDHPDLIAKRQEMLLANSKNDSAEAAARNLSRLRRELLLMRTESTMPGLGLLSDDPYGSLDGRIEASQIASLKQTITELEIERDSLLRQAADPALRTRLKVIRPATYDVKPASRKRMQVAIGGLILSFLGAFGVALWRESRSQLIRDAWRSYRSNRISILAQISEASVKKYGRVSPQDADHLRSKLSSENPDDRASVRALLAYRKIELSLFKACTGKVVCILSAGPRDVTSDFVYSLANIIVTDTGKRLLVIDGNATDPIIEKNSDGSGDDFIDSLLRGFSSKDLIIKSTPDRVFDLLSVTKPVVGERTRALQTGSLSGCFAQLNNLYDLILVRSLPEAYFIENVEICGAATDLVVAIDAQRTTFFDLSRSVEQVGRDKLRGLILVGT